MKRIKLDSHLKFIRSLPCLVSGDNVTVEAAHVRMSDARIAKVNPGVGQKPHDFYVVPLAGIFHREQHGMNERLFWDQRMIDPVLVALALYAHSGDYVQCWKIIEAQRQ
jgi:hypothetical protein